MTNLKSLLALILICFLIVGCEEQERTFKEIQELNLVKDSIDNDIHQNHQKELNNLGSWGGKRYFAKLKVKTSRFSLDPIKHMKDGMNSFEFYVPIDSIAYHEMKVGQNLKSDFRGGSFIVGGSISNTDIIVKDLVKR